MNTKYIIGLGLCAAVSAGCANAQIKFTVSNPAAFSRKGEIVEVPQSIFKRLPLAKGEAYIVRNAKGDTALSQMTFDGKLIFEAGEIAAGKTAAYSVTKGAPVAFAPKAYGRWVRERLDDFAWENNRVAFRIYGAALIATDGPSNGIDMWYKRTDELIVDKWYKKYTENRVSYHRDNGEGLDDYKVGHSLGGGAMAPFVNGELLLNENFVGAPEVLENGPLRVTFRLRYPPLNINGQQTEEYRQICLDANSYYAKITQSYGSAAPLNVAAGIVMRASASEYAVSPKRNYVIYDDPGENGGTAYIGVVLPQAADSVSARYSYVYDNSVTKKTEKYSHLLCFLTYRGVPVTYYAGYGWTKAGFAAREDFVRYTEDFLRKINQPLIVK